MLVISLYTTKKKIKTNHTSINIILIAKVCPLLHMQLKEIYKTFWSKLFCHCFVDVKCLSKCNLLYIVCPTP